jgi:uncharacterized protein (UPF0303 family)
MATADDIAKIIEQERGLEFSQFDEHVAFSIGTRVRERALREKLGLVVDVRTWDRQMFYAAMPGTTADNPNWVRRKINTVQRLLKSSYRVALEQAREDRLFTPESGARRRRFRAGGRGVPDPHEGVRADRLRYHFGAA